MLGWGGGLPSLHPFCQGELCRESRDQVLRLRRGALTRVGLGLGLCSQVARSRVPAPLLASWVTLGKWLSLSVPWFVHV